MRFRKSGVTIGVMSAACALTALAGPAQAAQAVQTVHSSFDPTGATFSCLSGDLTVVSGTVNEIDHFNTDNLGRVHVTGTITVHDVTLTDEQGNLYRLSGAAWFGATLPDMSDTAEPIVATDTEHFVIRSASGGAFAKVQVVSHISPNGDTFTFDMGSCSPPED
jgi:polyisoprenoid-binding protein YceI